MAKVTMALNVPLVIEQAKYLDWMPPGQFGSQLRLKGTIGGDPQAVLYLPGKAWATGRGLVNGGVIDEMVFDQEPEEAVNIPLLKTTFVLTNKQVPGKNYGNIVVGSQGELPGLAQAAPQSTKGRNAGPLLPGEEEGYLEAVAGQGGAAAKQEVDPQVQDRTLLSQAMAHALEIVKAAQTVSEEMGLDIPFTGDNACSLAACLFIKWTRK